MAGVCKVSLRAKIEELGMPLELVEQFTGAPDYCHYSYRVQDTEDVAEAIDLGSITEVDAIIIVARSHDLAIDTSYVSSFSEEITIAEGEFAVIKPAGTIYAKNHDEGETCVFDVFVIGS